MNEHERVTQVVAVYDRILSRLGPINDETAAQTRKLVASQLTAAFFTSELCETLADKVDELVLKGV